MNDHPEVPANPLERVVDDRTAPPFGRPLRWLDADQQDQRAAARDIAGRDRDQAAHARDAEAIERDARAGERETAAMGSALSAYARLDRDDIHEAQAEVAHERQLDDLQHVFDHLRSLPGVPPAVVDRLQFDVELRLDAAYATGLAMAYQRESERTDLRSIGHHLDADARDRIAATRDRTASASDRSAAEQDRQHGRRARHRAQLYRAADRTPR